MDDLCYTRFHICQVHILLEVVKKYICELMKIIDSNSYTFWEIFSFYFLRLEYINSFTLNPDKLSTDETQHKKLERNSLGKIRPPHN